MRKVRLGLHDGRGELAPRVYSSGKTQEDAISEILEAFESSDIVFFKGVVGSGKSVVGIRTALEFGRGIVSMPTKVLSDQYAQAYEREKFFVRCNGSRASLGVIKGRRNFPCLHLQERGWEGSAVSRSIPCRRPLRKSEGERRLDALRECRHWGFLFPKSYDREIRGTEKLPYTGISGEWMVCLRGGCPYWRQFAAYANSDVVIVNFAKWMAEIQIGRIPRVPITVVDEADEWLDSLALKAVISEKYIAKLLGAVKGKPEFEEVYLELRGSWESALNGRLDPLDFAELFVSILEELDETGDDIFWKIRAVLEHREGVECERRENSILFLIPDPESVLRRLFDRLNCKWLLMSATMQSREVMREVFGIDPVVVEGETEFPGLLIQRTVGLETMVNHESWSECSFRQNYWRCLEEIMRRSAKPSFIPVHAFKYLPEEMRAKLQSTSADVIKLGDTMISTKMDRGADLKGMKSVIVLKFPFPEVEDPLLKGMRKRLGEEAFRLYYRDMAERSFIQQIGRVLRSPDDVAEFWSPDLLCHIMLRRAWKGRISRRDSTVSDQG